MKKNGESLRVHNPAYRQDYYLYSGTYMLRSGKMHTYYYFSKIKKPGAHKELPKGYEIAISPRSQMFFLKRKDSSHKQHVKVFEI